MSEGELWPGSSDVDKYILSIASLFESSFSIDWLQELSKSKTTAMLMLLEKASQENVLIKKELGIYFFRDEKAKAKIKSLLPDDHREKLHKNIAALMMNEAPDNEQAVMIAASQLIQVSNDLDDCKILLDAGNRYRQRGISEKALVCYNKAIRELENEKGEDVDRLFVKTIIGYSKERLSLSSPEKTISLLKLALNRVEKLNDISLKAMVYLHLAAVEYQSMRYVSAQKYYDEGKELAKGTSDPNVQKTFDACTLLYYCYSGRFRDAIRKYESLEALISKKVPRYRLSLKVGIILGISYAFTGQIPQGLGLINQVRDDALASGDQDAAVRASVYIAWILILKNDLKIAAEQLHEVLKQSKKMDPITKSLANILQASIYFEKQEFKNVHKTLKKILKVRNKYSFTLRGHLFEFCLAAKQGVLPPIPEVSLENEILMSIEMGNILNQGMAYRYLAMLQNDKKQSYKEVFQNLERSLKLLEESGVLIEVARTKEAMGRYYLEQDNIEKAKEYVQAAARTYQEFGGRMVSDDLKHLLDAFQIKNDLFDEIINFGPEVLEIQDIKKVAQRILSTVIKITEAERGAIFLYNEKMPVPGIKLLSGKNIGPEDLDARDFGSSSKMILECAKKGKSILKSVDEFQKDFLKTDFIKSRICIPLLHRGKTIGVLYHDNRLFKNRLKKEDLKILVYFASLAAIALENAQAYEKIQTLNEKLSRERNYLEEQQLEFLQLDDFVAVSPEIKKVLSLVGRVADTEATVLILGDTGVGKEMVARAIHQQSSRKDKPFIRVNCSAFSEELIASELFGHEKGSFTGADKKRIGRFELADTGTLFLDEIGDISKDIQVRLLRVLQSKKFERVGSSVSIQSDFRLLTATNRNLEKAVAEGRFREDLYYRLNVFPIYVPPLRERLEDISPLALYFLKKYADKMNKSFKGIPESEMGKLLAYHWPGNVRELENVIERGVILNPEPFFNVPELLAGSGDVSDSGQLTLEEMERRFILDTVQKVNWKIHGPGGAAELLGMNHSTLYSRIKKLGIQKPEKRKS